MKEGPRLQAFLLALQTSPSVRKRYARNPEAEMKRFDLAPATVAAVIKGERAKLWWILTRGGTPQVGHVLGAVKSRRRRKP
jgi:hypothetical protein